MIDRSMPSVSVVVAVYNAESTIAECIESLLRLDYPRDRFEILCVDNDSNDRTAAILNNYAGRVKVLHEPRRGAAAARNRGIGESLADVIAFTDADCTVAPAWLTHLVELLAEGVGIVGGRIRARPGGNCIERFGEVIHDHEKAIRTARPAYAISMNWASPREVLGAAGGFDVGLLRSQDVDLSYRIGGLGYRLVYASEAVIYHRNERTPWGLFHEGYTHGVHARRVRERHTTRFGTFSRTDQLRRIGRRLRRAAQLAGEEAGFGHRACSVLFNVGKAAGELHALVGGRRD